MSLTGIAHGEAFKKIRTKALPSLTGFFRTPEGDTAFRNTTFRYPTKGLLSMRETPVSGEAFKLWMIAFVERLTGDAQEFRMPFLPSSDVPYPLDRKSLLGHTLPFSVDKYEEYLTRYTAMLAKRGRPTLLRKAIDPGAGSGANAYVLTAHADTLRRRYAYIAGTGEFDIARDCAELAALATYGKTKLLMRPDFLPDTFDRIAVDVQHMIDGTMEQDFGWIQRVEVHTPLLWADAFGFSDAYIDMICDTSMVEIKPARHVSAYGSCDQMLAHYLLYSMAHPDQRIDELRFYMARHAKWAVASVPEILSQFPVAEFGELLFERETYQIEKWLAQSEEDYFDYKRRVAGVMAWEMEDQVISVGRRYERAGRIGVTEIAEWRRVPHVLDVELHSKDDEVLPEKLQRAAEATRLEDIWLEEFHDRQVMLWARKDILDRARQHWRHYLKEQYPASLSG